MILRSEREITLLLYSHSHFPSLDWAVVFHQWRAHREVVNDPVEVVSCSSGGVWIEFEGAEGAVAHEAEESSDPLVEVVVIDSQLSCSWPLTTYRTDSTLAGEEIGVVSTGKSIGFSHVCVMVFVLPLLLL